MWKSPEQPCSDVPGVSGNEIYLSTIYKSRKHLLSRIGVLSFPRPTAMVKAIISKMVTNHQSTQISCNNKSSILMCTTSISELCGSRRNSFLSFQHKQALLMRWAKFSCQQITY
ncbi:Hypothetical_protein [Hexamita inflata]|uniref:Hypothetical_protein n=1 Tax=Hexamita inflata TaxID=28002 RepID=A0AA86PC26_9EUKA|nr:Hypothetical protein HINF_LOCUS23839 [Hexamita inflata]